MKMKTQHTKKLCNTPKAVVRRKFIAVNADVRKKISNQ